MNSPLSAYWLLCATHLFIAALITLGEPAPIFQAAGEVIAGATYWWLSHLHRGPHG